MQHKVPFPLLQKLNNNVFSIYYLIILNEFYEYNNTNVINCIFNYKSRKNDLKFLKFLKFFLYLLLSRLKKFKLVFTIQYSPSINSQCPVSTQIQTINNAIEKDNSSAVVKRPHIPNEILKGKKTLVVMKQYKRYHFEMQIYLFPSEQGLIMY